MLYMLSILYAPKHKTSESSEIMVLYCANTGPQILLIHRKRIWYLYIYVISFIPMDCLSYQNVTTVLSIFAINAISQHFCFCKVYTKGSLIFSFDRVYFPQQWESKEFFLIYLSWTWSSVWDGFTHRWIDDAF